MFHKCIIICIIREDIDSYFKLYLRLLIIVEVKGMNNFKCVDVELEVFFDFC